MRIDLFMTVALVTLVSLAAGTAAAQPLSSPPVTSLTNLFDGKDLGGWRGRPGGGGVFSPYVEADITTTMPEDLAEDIGQAPAGAQ